METEYSAKRDVRSKILGYTHETSAVTEDDTARILAQIHALYVPRALQQVVEIQCFAISREESSSSSTRLITTIASLRLWITPTSAALVTSPLRRMVPRRFAGCGKLVNLMTLPAGQRRLHAIPRNPYPRVVLVVIHQSHYL